MPRFSEDDVVDFVVLEAVVTKGAEEEKQARKDKEKEDWRGKDARKDWAKEQGLV